MRSIILYSTLILLIFSCRNSQEAGRQESRLRVVNGQLVGSDDPTIKSTVAIFKSKFDKEPHCTGTLIGRNHVVTAAHCLTKMPAKVGFGSKGHDSSFNVVAYKLHPSYISFRQTFDLGVIVFEGKLDPKKHQPVAIGEPKIGVPVKISGYGDIGDSRLGGGTLRIVDTSIARFRDSGREFVSVADGKGLVMGILEVLSTLKKMTSTKWLAQLQEDAAATSAIVSIPIYGRSKIGLVKLLRT